MNEIETKCDNCGKTIKEKLYFIKQYKHHFCNRKCMGGFFKTLYKGENSIYWRGGKVEVKCDYCGETTKKIPAEIKRTKYHFCNCKCQGNFFKTLYKGENSIYWRGGISNEPYSFDFDDILKEQVRKRDNFTCQECGVLQKDLNGYHKKLPIHHIDYNKKNSNPSNLITLCRGCNAKANFNRNDWTKHFQEKIGLLISNY